MMNKDTKKDKVSVPREVFESMKEAYKKWDKFAGDFEDFSLSKDKDFIKDMKKARKEHKTGKLKELNV